MRTFQAAVALVATLLVALGWGSPSSATPTPAGTEPVTSPEAQDWPGGLLVLSITQLGPTGAENPAPASGSDRVLLLCSPDGGTHPDASTACDSLRDVGGELTDLPWADDSICTTEYAPVEVEARGRWEGEPVAYRETFSNRCMASAETDAVFGF